MTVTSTHSTDDIIENWDYPIDPYPDSDLYKLLQVISSQNRRIDLEIEEIYDDRFLETATGTELEKIGSLVGVKRKASEGDAKLRKRTHAEFVAQASDTTFETFAAAVLSILDAEPGNVSVETPPETPDKVVNVEVDGGIIDDNPLTTSELKELLDKTVSAGATVNLIEVGTFAFAGDDSSLEGWNEGTWSSTQ